MHCYRLTKTALRDLESAADTAERIAHALEGIARFADQTNRGEIGDNLTVLSETLHATAADIAAITSEPLRVTATNAKDADNA